MERNKIDHYGILEAAMPPEDVHYSDKEHTRKRTSPVAQIVRRSRGNKALFWCTYLCFIAVALSPAVRRLYHPTILTDDVIRIVNLIDNPLRDLLFKPFNEHVAFLFEIVSWVTWQAIGHDLSLAPVGFTIASLLPWVLVLALFGYWLDRETGSRTASFVAVAIVAQSPLVMDTAWWYSASSFSWAILGILLALVGVLEMKARLGRAMILIFLGTFLGPAGSSLGHLAMPLTMLRAVVDEKAPWPKRFLASVAATGGLLTYLGICSLGGVHSFPDRLGASSYLDPWSGLAYALSVPGRVLLPVMIGFPGTWCVNTLPRWAGWSTGILLLIGLMGGTLWIRAPWHRRTVVLGTAMIYLAYGVIYTARACLMTQVGWSEAQLIYLNGPRYHVLPLLGLTTVLATLVAAWRPIRRCDQHPGRPELVGCVVGAAMLTAQYGENTNPNLIFLLNQPDQKATMTALHHVGQIAREKGITRAQLLRITSPAFRAWNPWNPTTPTAFAMMNLVDAPRQVEHPLSDDRVRTLLLERLTEVDRIALGTGACAATDPRLHGGRIETLSVARPILFDRVYQRQPGRFNADSGPGRLVYEFKPTSEARFLLFPGLKTEQSLDIYFRDTNRLWRPARFLRWTPSPHPGGDGVIDLSRMIHLWGEPVTQIAVHFTQAGEITLEGPPRLLR